MKGRKVTEWSAEELGTMMLAFAQMNAEARELRMQYKVGGFANISIDDEGVLGIHLYASDDENMIGECVSIVTWANTDSDAKLIFEGFIERIKDWANKYRDGMTASERLELLIKQKQAELAKLKADEKMLTRKK